LKLGLVDAVGMAQAERHRARVIDPGSYPSTLLVISVGSSD